MLHSPTSLRIRLPTTNFVGTIIALAAVAAISTNMNESGKTLSDLYSKNDDWGYIMDQIDIVAPIGKRPDGNLTRTVLHALTYELLDEFRPRETIRRALQHLLETISNLAREIVSVIEWMRPEAWLGEYPDKLFETRQVHDPEANHQTRSGRMPQEMNRRLIEARKSERRYLAGELHDQIGQTLTVLNLNLSLAQKRLSTESSADGA